MSDFEGSPVERITIGAVGEPGARVFLLQAKTEDEVYTLLLEKEQAMAIGRACYDLLVHRGRVDMIRALLGEGGVTADDPAFSDQMALEEDEPIWRVGEIALGFDEESSLAVIYCREVSEVEDDPQASQARFWMTEAQVAALGVHAMTVVAQGRPLCPICGLPIEADGHICPGTNGHSPSFVEN